MKDLVSKIYKKLWKLNIKKSNNPGSKWEKGMKKHYTEEDIQMEN